MFEKMFMKKSNEKSVDDKLGNIRKEEKESQQETKMNSVKNNFDTEEVFFTRSRLFLEEIKKYIEEARFPRPKLVTGTLKIYNTLDRTSSVLVRENLFLFRTWHQAYVLLEDFEREHVTNQVEYLCGRIKSNEEQSSLDYLFSKGAYTLSSVAKSFTPNDIMIPDADHVIGAYGKFIDEETVREVEEVPEEHKKTMELIREYYI